MRPPLAAFAEPNTIEKIRMAEGAWSRDAIVGGRYLTFVDLPSGQLRKAMGLWWATSFDEWSTVVATN